METNEVIIREESCTGCKSLKYCAVLRQDFFLCGMCLEELAMACINAEDEDEEEAQKSKLNLN